MYNNTSASTWENSCERDSFVTPMICWIQSLFEDVSHEKLQADYATSLDPSVKIEAGLHYVYDNEFCF